MWLGYLVFDPCAVSESVSDVESQDQKTSHKASWSIIMFAGVLPHPIC